MPKIARELHDDLGGNLTAIKLGLSAITNQLNQNQNNLKEHTLGYEAIVDKTFETVP